VSAVRVFTTSFPQHADDPAGHFVAALALGLVEAGHAVTVEAAGASLFSPPGVRVRGWSGGALFGAEGAPDRLSRGGAGAWLGAAAALSRVTSRGARRRGQQQVSIGHWLLPCGPAALAAGGRVVLYAHGSDVALLERLPAGAALARALDAGADHLNFVSDDLRRRFEALLGRPPRAAVTTLSMGLASPAPDFAALDARLPPRAPGERRVVTVGRLVHLKGFDVLADALAGRPDVLWLAAGDGPERAELTRRCAARGVRFLPLGALGPGERDALLRRADVFVLPSRPVGRRAEGTPLSLLEAQLAGLPCIASRLGGVPEAAAPGGTTLVPPEDAPALAAALHALLDTPDAAARRAAAGAACSAFAQNYTWARLMPAHLRAMLGE
jgi:glycosyltransferase involved in cell wall biosynthesis